MSLRVSWMLVALTVGGLGCSGSSADDNGTPVDAALDGFADAELGDTTLADTSAQDSPSDTAKPDVDSGDTGIADTGAGDTGNADTATADTGNADTATADTGIADTGVADSAKTDTASSDTGSSDGGGLGLGAKCGASSECASGLLCCYPCGIPGCTNQCSLPAPGGGCPLLP